MNPEYHNFFHHFSSSIYIYFFLIKIKTVHIKNADIIDYFYKKNMAICKLLEKQQRKFNEKKIWKFCHIFVAFSKYMKFIHNIMYDFFFRIFPYYLTKIHPTLVPFLLPVWHMTITGSDYLNLAAVVERLLVRIICI